jgi:hypothetical protein
LVTRVRKEKVKDLQDQWIVVDD